ncbi:MAG: sigma-70 family RNA polymerase sigma factor [Bacteroidales bacterium]|nr:sigma-70 family RNA polymerase sigma factor [Bacteroidales bacterium]MDD3152477.1 sigma-70 family RNA polymerase sigma factor [Bacteroidales bacterium]MDD3914637.1 sigma-70 family RNA polymerase sigma factor [Bacteroidales bacterium]MDD4633794.1 sigma-70 family RNA polymerase sigma factor [Bacteroidales bacterium]
MKFIKLFAHNLSKITSNKTLDIKSYINDFFIYLYENDWRRLKTYDPELSLKTWMSTVSYRFFLNSEEGKIDFVRLNPIYNKDDDFVDKTSENQQQTYQDWLKMKDSEILMDINYAIKTIKNERDREIAELMLLQGYEPQQIAEKFNLSVDYVYTVKNRILKSIKNTLKEYNYNI